MFQMQWAESALAAERLYQALTTDLRDNIFYKHSTAIAPLLATLVAFTYALYILAYPPRYRKLSIALLAIPVSYAFWHQTAISVSASLNDTYGRFLYIWFANMSYEVTILEFSPHITKENDGWRSRLREAYKVLFARAHPESGDVYPPKKFKHTYSKREFLLRHAWKAAYLFVLQALYSVFVELYIHASPVHGPDKALFFRRLPQSLDLAEMWDRFDLTVYWCIVNMWMYESYHSVFALFFVGLGLDHPRDWSMSLFGSVLEAWSVRRYWGKHWHDYIYHSFSGHTKIVTRKWLGMRRGLARRLVENTMVFGVSGLMHSAVRYAQNGNNGDCMCITLWYLGQMLPIVIEGFAQEYWARFKTARGIQDTKWLVRCEKLLGYAWVIAFNMWSVSKYVHTRNDWADKHWRKKYAKEIAWYYAQKNKTGGTVEPLVLEEKDEL